MSEPIDCNHEGCDRPATWTDEAPPRTATANDWWCDEHVALHPVAKGWERVSCDWNLRDAVATLRAQRDELVGFAGLLHPTCSDNTRCDLCALLARIAKEGT